VVNFAFEESAPKSAGGQFELESFAQEFDNGIADDRGDKADGEIGWSKDVMKSSSKRFAAASGAIELTH
jgi:hypothetical protein